MPTAVWAVVWLAGELIAAMLPGPHRWMWEWFPGYLVPLWFLGVYGLLIATVPVTATLHARFGSRVLVVFVGLIAVGSVLGRGVGLAWPSGRPSPWCGCSATNSASRGGAGSSEIGRWLSGWPLPGPAW